MTKTSNSDLKEKEKKEKRDYSIVQIQHRELMPMPMPMQGGHCLAFSNPERPPAKRQASGAPTRPFYPNASAMHMPIPVPIITSTPSPTHLCTPRPPYRGELVRLG
jgi:hypothetical protein